MLTACVEVHSGHVSLACQISVIPTLESYPTRRTSQNQRSFSTQGYVTVAMQFWKPGTLGPGSLLDRASETEDVVLSSAPISAALSLQAQRQQLPIFKHSKVSSYAQYARTDTGR